VFLEKEENGFSHKIDFDLFLNSFADSHTCSSFFRVFRKEEEYFELD